jgi:hypothetical protein
MSEEQTQTPVDTRTASQKIQDLERAVMAGFQTMDNITRDILTIKEAIKLLGNKVDSIVKASERGLGLNDDVLSNIMIENNVAELKDKVTNLVTQGILGSQEAVDDNSFLVGREISDSGEVVNPRLQFALHALREDMREKLKGARPGNIIVLEEGKLKFELLETYTVVTSPTAAPVPAPAEQVNA